MMRFELAGDIAPMSATACGAAALITSAADVAMQLLGVPLPVVLAAGAGAWIARARAPAGPSFGRDLVVTIGWWLAGCFLTGLAAWVLEAAFGVKVPTNAHAGLAAVVSWGLPILLPIAEAKLPKAIEAWFDRKTKGGGDA